MQWRDDTTLPSAAHCPVSGHDRAIYDAGCSSGVTIGTRACTATMTLPRVSASSRLESWASRSCNPRTRTQCGRPTMAGSRSSPSSRRARGKSCRSPGGSQPSSLPAHRASRESARTLLWHDTRQVPSQRGGTSLGCSRQLLANDVSFDHLVGAGEHGCRDFDAERLGRLQVDYQLELRRLFYRELAGFSPLQYLIDVNSRTVTDCVRIGSI